MKRKLTLKKYMVATIAVIAPMALAGALVAHELAPKPAKVHPPIAVSKPGPVAPDHSGVSKAETLFQTSVPLDHTPTQTDIADRPGHHPTFHTTITNQVVDPKNPLRRLDPLAGVWDPGRLKVINPCLTVSGTVKEIMHEPNDADYHMNVQLDPQYTHLLNSHNESLVHGDLVVEIIPLDQGHVPIPSVGQHITFTGAYVLDTEHGWMEIHPAWLINGKGSVAYTESQLQQSMQEITNSYENLVKSATITVASSHLTVHPGEDASITIKTVPGAGGNIAVVYSSTQALKWTTYADEDGIMTFEWPVNTQVKPGSYAVYVRLYTHTAKFVLQVN